MPDEVPALTDAEARFVDAWLAAVDVLGRLNPAHAGPHGYGLLRAAQALPRIATDLRAAAEDMWHRGEREVFGPTLVQALLALDGERRSARVAVRRPPPAAE